MNTGEINLQVEPNTNKDLVMIGWRFRIVDGTDGMDELERSKNYLDKDKCLVDGLKRAEYWEGQVS